MWGEFLTLNTYFFFIFLWNKSDYYFYLYMKKMLWPAFKTSFRYTTNQLNLCWQVFREFYMDTTKKTSVKLKCWYLRFFKYKLHLSLFLQKLIAYFFCMIFALLQTSQPCLAISNINDENIIGSPQIRNEALSLP